jgi:hypothetical protein
MIVLDRFTGTKETQLGVLGTRSRALNIYR